MGRSTKFHFRTHLFGPGLALDAFEIYGGHPAGYQFQIIGEPEEDLLVLLGRLIEKTRRGLSKKHLKKEEYGLQISQIEPYAARSRGRRPGWLRTAPQHRWSGDQMGGLRSHVDELRGLAIQTANSR